MVYLDNYLLTLNSKYASTFINGSAKSNVQFNFIGLLRDDADIIRTSLSVLNAQIPVSFYIITANNNIFIYGDNQVGDQYTITIPIGNYDANTLIAYMNTQLSLYYPFVLSINSSTGKLIVSTTSIYNRIRIYSALSSCADVFGLGSISIAAVAGPNGYTMTFPYPLNLLGVKKISVKSSSLSITAFSSVNKGYSDTICTIPADQPAFGMISYTNQNDLNNNLLKQSVVDKVDIQLLDENNNYLDFNNIDWTITISLSNERVDRERDMKTIRDITRMDNSINKPLEITENKPIELTKDEEELKLLEK